MPRQDHHRDLADHSASNRFAWLLTAGVVVIDAGWLAWQGWSMSWQGVAFIAVVLLLGGGLMSIRRYRRDLRIRVTLEAAALLITFTAAAGTLSYLAVSTDAPLIDDTLSNWDRALGFDWMALDAWMQQHERVRGLLTLAYFTGLPQMAFVVVYLGFNARVTALDAFTRTLLITTLLTIAVSAAFPAAGAWKYYGVGAGFDLTSLSHFELLRAGAMRHVPLEALQGLISIPSMHAATGLLLVYAMRGSGVLLPVFVVLNAAMLASTPIDGSHYLVDVLAGIGLAVGVIVVDRRHFLRPARSGIALPSTRLEVLQQ